MKQTILVVDDDKNIRNLLQINLVADGYEVMVAEHGEQAIDVFKSAKPRIVLLDIMMPGTDGWEVAKFIRDTDPHHDVKIIMLTARDTARDKMIGTHVLKADHYITKPFDLTKLLTVIREMAHEQ